MTPWIPSSRATRPLSVALLAYLVLSTTGAACGDDDDDNTPLLTPAETCLRPDGYPPSLDYLGPVGGTCPADKRCIVPLGASPSGTCLPKQSYCNPDQPITVSDVGSQASPRYFASAECSGGQQCRLIGSAIGRCEPAPAGTGGAAGAGGSAGGGAGGASGKGGGGAGAAGAAGKGGGGAAGSGTGGTAGGGAGGGTAGAGGNTAGSSGSGTGGGTAGSAGSGTGGAAGAATLTSGATVSGTLPCMGTSLYAFTVPSTAIVRLTTKWKVVDPEIAGALPNSVLLRDGSPVDDGGNPFELSPGDIYFGQPEKIVERVHVFEPTIAAKGGSYLWRFENEPVGCATTQFQASYVTLAPPVNNTTKDFANGFLSGALVTIGSQGERWYAVSINTAGPRTLSLSLTHYPGVVSATEATVIVHDAMGPLPEAGSDLSLTASLAASESVGSATRTVDFVAPGTYWLQITTLGGLPGTPHDVTVGLGP